jgi:hypothetical protein
MLLLWPDPWRQPPTDEEVRRRLSVITDRMPRRTPDFCGSIRGRAMCGHAPRACSHGLTPETWAEESHRLLA